MKPFIVDFDIQTINDQRVKFKIPVKSGLKSDIHPHLLAIRYKEYDVILSIVPENNNTPFIIGRLYKEKLGIEDISIIQLEKSNTFLIYVPRKLNENELLKIKNQTK